MALMSCNVKVIGRASRADARQPRSPRSATGAAAYRASALIVDARTGMVHDYRRKGGVDHCVILAPGAAPRWVFDRALLWNAVEQSEKRKDGQLAREVMAAIPRELSRDQGIALVEGWARTEFVARGMVADLCFHKLTSQNPHVHILLTLREIGANGLGQKNRDWNDRALVETWRASWATACNRALAAAGSTQTIDHRSYARQGLDIEATHHLGPLASAMESRGIQTELGNLNRAILQRRSLWQLLAQESSQLLRELRKAVSELWSLQRRQAQASEVMTQAWQRLDLSKPSEAPQPDSVSPTLQPK